MNTDLILYYNERAKEYENIYSRAERQPDLLLASGMLQNTFADKDVFEMACGTGYWTSVISSSARQILATDINESVMDIAKAKNYFPASVTFQKVDLFTLAGGKHESLFGGFIWSHIDLRDLDKFIGIANRMVERGGTVVFMDNNYVEGSSLPITAKDEAGNTYQTRTLENGTMHNVLKNFPSESSVRQVLQGKASDIRFNRLTYYWILTYKNSSG